MPRLLGILTKDFRLYHDLVSHLKDRDLPFQSLSFTGKIPKTVDVILTSEEEFEQVQFARKVAVTNVEDGVSKALRLLRGKRRYESLVIGIDPGKVPGVAVVGDGEVIETRLAASPEAVLHVAQQVLEDIPAKQALIRIGHGDKTNRNRIINAVSRLRLEIEIVDEKGTTRRTPQPDIDAAIDIAFASGKPAERRYEIEPTRGELREIQRWSRITSGGRITISKELAGTVVRGEQTLAEAIEKQRQARPKP